MKTKLELYIEGKIKVNEIRGKAYRKHTKSNTKRYFTIYLLPTDLFCQKLAAKSALRVRESFLLVANNKGYSNILSKFSCLPLP